MLAYDRSGDYDAKALDDSPLYRIRCGGEVELTVAARCATPVASTQTMQIAGCRMLRDARGK